MIKFNINDKGVVDNVITTLMEKENFSDIEKNIVNFILKEGEKVCSLNIKEFAEMSYTSPSTVMRFCKKLGSKGFADFKIKLKGEFVHISENEILENPNFPFFSTDTYEQVASKIATLTEQSIYEAKNSIDYNTVTRFVNLIKSTHFIDIYGQGSSFACAYEFKTKMTRLGKCVRLEAGFSDQINQAINSNNEHAAILISHSGENQQTLRIARILNKTNTKIVSITHDMNNKLVKLCHYNFYTGVQEKNFLSSKLEIYSSYVATQYLLDCFYSFIYLSDFDKNLDKTKQNEYTLNQVE